jgi:hypothetical protein
MLLAFCGTILLMSVGARDLMRDTQLVEEGVETFILSTPVSLNNKNLPIKEAFNKGLKFKKICENIRFVTQQVNPSKFTIIINKRDMIFFQPKDSMTGPHTSEKMSSKGADDRLEEIEYGNW